MGGFGSGRPRYKLIAEDCRALDVSQLNREGSLQSGRRGNWIWLSKGREVARIGYHTTISRLILEYRVKIHGRDWEQITQSVPLEYIKCHFDGQRPYFICPGIVSTQRCNRRVGKLFAGGKYFLCRHCYNVAYQSQSEAQHDRLLRRANKLRMALDGEHESLTFMAKRPKGMWQKTYQRKMLEIEKCEEQANIAFIRKYAHILSTREIEMYFGDSQV